MLPSALHVLHALETELPGGVKCFSSLHKVSVPVRLWLVPQTHRFFLFFRHVFYLEGQSIVGTVLWLVHWSVNCIVCEDRRFSGIAFAWNHDSTWHLSNMERTYMIFSEGKKGYIQSCKKGGGRKTLRLNKNVDTDTIRRRQYFWKGKFLKHFTYCRNWSGSSMVDTWLSKWGCSDPP